MPPDPRQLDFSTALPDRPIRVTVPPTVGPASAAGLFLLLAGLIFGALGWLGPDIVRDWRIGRDPQAAADLKVEAASCGTRVFFIKACEVRYTGTGRGGAFWYLFVEPAGEPEVTLLRSRSNPELITTNLGQAKLVGRTITLLAIVALLAVCIRLSVQVVLQGRATERAFAGLDGQRLRTVVVNVQDNFTVAHNRRRWTYLYDAGGGAQATGIVELGSKDEPLFVTQDRRNALAVAGADGGVPMLLETNVKALDLSEVEREAFYAACRRVLGPD